jgi:hypothetical protein
MSVFQTIMSPKLIMLFLQSYHGILAHSVFQQTYDIFCLLPR